MNRFRILSLGLLSLMACQFGARGEVILQYFETEWEEIYRRMPEISEIGYSGIWHPSPAKSPVSGGPFAGGGNVGYSLFDRFDLGDIPQRGDRATRYGSRGHLRKMVDAAHQTDVKIYPDIVMNHAGNGPNFWTYPGMKPNDFHGWWDGNQPGGFRRAERMNAWGDINDGWGLTFQQELVSLIDIVTERDNRFSNTRGYAVPDVFVRHPGRYDLYPFHNPGQTLPAEHPVDFLNRWIVWLGDAMNYDGARFDAPKHVVADFFGQPGWGFNHELQYSYKSRRGFTNYSNIDELYQNDLRRRDSALIFSEFFIGGQGEIDYWRNFGNKFRYIDFPRKSQMVWPAFNEGNLAALSSFAGFSPAEGVMFIESHDETPPWRRELGYAYILTRVGVPIVYTTGNNLANNESKVNTWMFPGYPGALGDYNLNRIPNLVYINNNFARGNEWERWSEGNFYAFERYDDLNSNGSPQTGEGLLLVALSTSGGNNTRTVQTAFQSGTVLKDYTGNAGNITVASNGTVSVTVPASVQGGGYVAYAPVVSEGPATGEPIRFNVGGNPVGTMNWIVPGGRFADAKPRQIPRLTGDTVDIDIHFTATGGAVDAVMIKWGEGDIAPNANTTANFYNPSRGIVSGGYQRATQVAPGHWRLTADVTQFPEGLNTIKARVFNQRASGLPALFQTFTKVVYVDRRGPDLQLVGLTEGATVRGSPMVRVENPDRLAAAVEFSVDGTNWSSADRVMPGVWQFAMPAVAAGARTLSVRAGEYDWGATRTRINESTVTRNLTVEAPSIPLAITFNGHVRPDSPANEIHMPFFRVNVEADQALSAANVKLFWNEFEMVGLSKNGANFSTIFDGRFRVGSEEQRLWGSFVNGPHVFRAEVTHNGQTYHVSRRVVFNLYGQNLIDSDGDGIPDNVEMPFFDAGTNPGYGRTWPGDNNEDMIPNFGENWTRLNPMNHDTTYNNTWDGQEDWSGDGYSNLYKVRRGYWDEGDAYQYSIYQSHAGQLGNEANFDFGGAGDPGDGGVQPGNPGSATVSPGTPDNTDGGATVTVTYTPGEGVLAGADKVFVHLGFNGWQLDVRSREMTESNGVWSYTFTLPDEAFAINFVFRNEEATVWDNNSSRDWSTTVIPLGGIGGGFVMDGQLDSSAFEIAEYNGMKLWAAVRGTTLYVATWGTGQNSNDHFIYLSNELGDADDAAWGKAGVVFLKDKIFLAGEGDQDANSYADWFGAAANSTDRANAKGSGASNYLEGTLDLIANFGSVPEAVYLAVGVYQTADGGALTGQVPAAWDTNDNLEVTEFLRVPIKSIRDDRGDGHFDGGNPRMWTVVNDNEQDANYGLRRFFLDEIRGEQEWMTVQVEPRTGRDAQITEIEVFTNLNRRDYAKLPGDEDPDQVTSTSLDTYYLGHPMQPAGAGRWSATLPVHKCGAYRINARWRFEGSSTWHYYTDNGLRRDTAVVVSPKKALDTVMYELNPLTAESINNEFNGRSTFLNMVTDEPGRPNRINPANLQNLGVNMIWLQPIHPIGTIGRETDPLTGSDYDPGSPYAVRNYWQVNPVLGAQNTAENAMQEFQQFVTAYNDKGIGIMLDGTFNHSAWDAEIGLMATRLDLRRPDGGVINPSQRISEVRPGWYSKKGNYGEPATFFVSMEDNDIAEAPDRIDFGKWADAADFFFGRYDALVQGPVTPGIANNWFSGWFQRYLREDDNLEPLSPQTKELWEYFANYSLFWLEQTGLTPGLSLEQQAAGGIAGLRCDFAQGLPNEFWEYAINKTRSVKWDFLFMAESLDGNRVIDGSPRHGVGYRSARHFDILNENMVFLWRDQFFNYRTFPEQAAVNPNKTTGLLFNAFDLRKNAFELSPILLNLTSHDEIFPTDDQWSMLYAYAIVNTMDGVPMIFYGQEMGAQNNILEYGGRSDFGIGADNNFGLYESNFGKSIPNFKRYNSMTNIWSTAGWKSSLLDTYSRLNRARLNSPALRSQQNYFLDDAATGQWNPDIFAVAKVQQPGVSADQQDVVFAFVNNDFRANQSRAATFRLNATNSSGANWFGIQPGRNYNVVDLTSTNPTAMLWGTNGITGSTLIASGIYVGFQTNATFSGGQAQYLRLIDMTAGMTATNVNDYFANVERLAAPQIDPIGNRTVQVGQSLNFPVVLTVASGDTATIAAASSLAPANWTFGGASQFVFTPDVSEIGTHTFRFTATGRDGYSEETFTVTVTGADTASAFELWSIDRFGTDAEGNLLPDGLPDADPDGDGASNLAEFHLGTDPLDPNSRLHLTAHGVTNNNVTLQVQPVATNGAYWILQTGSLNAGWTNQAQQLNRGQHLSHPQGLFTWPAADGLRTFFTIIYEPPAE